MTRILYTLLAQYTPILVCYTYQALPSVYLSATPCHNHAYLSLPTAFSAAKDAAGNIDMNKLQQLQQMGQALADDTASKKED